MNVEKNTSTSEAGVLSGSTRRRVFFTWTLQFKVIVIISLLVIGSGLAALSLVYQELSLQLIANKEQQLASDTDIQATHIQAHIRELVRDIKFLSRNPSVQQLANNPYRSNAEEQPPSDDTSQQLNTVFVELLKSKPQYTQVRFIGVANHGREIIRADRYGPGGSIQSVYGDALQQKGSRGYFQDTVQLGQHQVYLSKIQLNREYGELTVPYQPVLRSAVPVFDQTNTVTGIVIINENLQHLFAELKETYNADHDYILINDQGDYLVHPDPAKSFAFEFDGRANAFDDFPELKNLFLETDPKKTRRSIIAPYASGALVAISFAYNPLDPTQKIGIIALGKREHIESLAHRALNRSLVLIAITMLIAIVLGLFLLERIALPFETILEAIKKYDIRETLKILPATQPGPAGVISRALRGYLTEIEDKTEKLLHEIHERDQVEADLNEVNRALFKANSELEQFAYIASHDLKAPLRVIANTSSWLIEDLADKLSDENLSNLKLMRQRAQRMENMLTDLFEYLKSGSEDDSSLAVKMSAKELIDEVIYILHPPEAFAIHYEGELENITVSKLPLRHLLLNLVANAINHNSSENPNISIRVDDSDNYYVFSVTDNGPGIDPAYHEKIFEPFTTLQPRDQTEGTGLGLAIAKQIADSHGGFIKLESAPGKGSTFKLYWPKAIDDS